MQVIAVLRKAVRVDAIKNLQLLIAHCNSADSLMRNINH